MAFNDFFRVINNKHSLKLFMPISAAYFFFAFGWGILTPIFAIFINNITGDLFLTGIILGVWGLVGIVSDVPFGILIDKISAKKAMQICLAAYLLITLAYTFATNFWQLLGVRIVHSFFGALMWVAVWVYMYSHVKPKKAAQEIGIFSEFYDVAATIAPLLTGIVVAFSFFAPFYLLSVLCFMSFMIITLFLPDSKNHNGKDHYIALMKREVNTIFKLGWPLFAFVVFIVIFFGMSNVIWNFVPILMHQAGLSYAMIGVVIAAATLPAVLFEIPIGWTIDKIGKDKVAMIGLILSAVSVLILSQTIDLFHVVTAMFIFGISSIMLVLTINTVASSFTTKETHGGLAGAISTFKDIGNMAGPILGGLSLALLSNSKTLFIMALIFFATALPVYLLIKKINPILKKV